MDKWTHKEKPGEPFPYRKVIGREIVECCVICGRPLGEMHNRDEYGKKRL